MCLFYLNSAIAIADPSLLEERRSEATVVFGINSYRELCGLHFGGITLASLEMIVKCANQGAKRANAMVQQIKAALEADEKRRLNCERVGFMPILQSDVCCDTHSESRLFIRLPNYRTNEDGDMENELQDYKKEQTKIKSLGDSSAILMPAEELSSEDEYGDNWIPDHDEDSENMEIVTPASEENPTEKRIKPNLKQHNWHHVETKSEDSEEENTVVMKDLK